MNKLSKKFYNTLEYTDKVRLVNYLALSLAALFLELISISILYPFLMLINNIENEYIVKLVTYLGVEYPSKTTLLTIFVVFVVCSYSLRFYILRYSLFFSADIGTRYALKYLKNFMSIGYEEYKLTSSSEIIASLSTRVSSLIYNFIIPILTIATNTIILVGVLVILLAINPQALIIIVAIVGFLYITISMLVKKILKKISKEVLYDQNQTVDIIKNIHGSFKDIILTGSEKQVIEDYKNYDKRLRRNGAISQLVGSTPRFLLELIFILIVIFTISVFIKDAEVLVNSMPLIGVYLLSFQKTMPLIQQIYASITSYKSNKESVSEIIYGIENHKEKNIFFPIVPLESPSKRIFIEMESTSFRYSSKKYDVFSNVNLSLESGNHYGVVGPSGVGKSTIMDLILALLKPYNGKLKFNNIQIGDHNRTDYWKNITHIPQNIYIKKGSIKDNIILENKYCEDKFKYSINQACLEDLLFNLDNNINYELGDSGCKISGGQRQRIGIARAFYTNKNIWLLDEATSALDQTTQDKIYNNIVSDIDGKIIVSITHNDDVIKHCNKIIKIDSGKVSIVNN